MLAVVGATDLVCQLLSVQQSPVEDEEPGRREAGRKGSLQWPVQQPRGSFHQRQSTEAGALDHFRSVLTQLTRGRGL